MSIREDLVDGRFLPKPHVTDCECEDCPEKCIGCDASVGYICNPCYRTKMKLGSATPPEPDYYVCGDYMNGQENS